MTSSSLLKLMLLISVSDLVTAELCGISSGGPAVIIDIAESQGTQTSQRSSPEQLPINGEVGTEITLSLQEDKLHYFKLEGSTLVLDKPLDRDEEDLSSIRFQILCTVLSSGTVKNIPVIVRVEDINDNVPVFQGTPYSFTVKEDVAIGTTAFRDIKATDIDAGLHQQLEYSIIQNPDPNFKGSDGAHLFSIPLPHQGFIRLNSALDYETSDSYFLVVQASDQGPEATRRTATTTIRVDIEDVDDLNPKFILDFCLENPSHPDCLSSPLYKSSVNAGKLEGVLSITPYRIEAKDPDSLNAPIRYSFIAGSPLSYSQFFSIDPRTGIVTQTAPVNDQGSEVFNITVKAQEQTRRRGSSTALLQIKVITVDKSPPKVIASSYNGRVDENSPRGTPVMHESNSSIPLMFSLMDPNQPNLLPSTYIWELTSSSFEVDSNGRLLVAESGLNRDPPNLGTHTFQVIARERQEGGSSSTPIRVSVELQDVNDNPPKFPVYPLVTVTAGNQRRQIIQVEAQDKDAGINSEINYRIGAVDRPGPFMIDRNTGVIQVIGEVTAGEQYSLNVVAQDGGGLETMTVINIQVSRAPNAGGPSFPKSSYTVVVAEDSLPGYKIIKLKAVDPDGDVPRYSLVSGNEKGDFDVDTLSGVLTVIHSLDREILDSYNLVIKAEDEEGRYSTVSIRMIIGDVNDNEPQFTEESYSFNIDEGLNNRHIGQIKATDRDIGEAGKVSYSLENGDEFLINSATGVIKTVKPLDYEKVKVHNIIVIAKDNGKPRLETTATIAISVNDLKDESPKFLKQEYKVSVIESALPGVILTSVKAVDPDTEPEVSYYIKSGETDTFHINPDTGEISLKSELDFEKSQNHSLIIATNENDSRQKLATTKVIIMVEDVNDNGPVFQQLQSSLVPQTVPIGTLITPVIAIDADGSAPNNKITYELSGDDPYLENFIIDSEDAILRTKNSLIEMPVGHYQIKVVARDNGDPVLLATTNVPITVISTSVNEEIFVPGHSSPTVLKSASFLFHDAVVEISEDVIEGQIVTKLPVTNKPKDYSTNLSCSILESHLHEIFEALISKEGDCDVKIGSKKLDYETKTQYNFTVNLHSVASPLPTKETQATITLNILDVNDNAPKFLKIDAPLVKNPEDQPIVYTVINKDAPSGSEVIQITAEDIDSGPGGKLMYSLVPGSNRGGYFTVDSHNGLIKTTRSLTDVPYQLLPFNITLLAMDNPSHPTVHHTISASIIVNVIDKSNQIVVAVSAPVQTVRNDKKRITEVISDASNHMVLIEKVEKHKFLNGTETLKDSRASDVWLNIVDPKSGKVLTRDNPSVLPLLLEGPDKERFIKEVSNSLEGTNAFLIRQPDLTPVTKAETKEEEELERVRTATAIEGSQLALFTLGAAIILLGTIAIVVICCSWLKYTKRRNLAEKTFMVPVLAPSIDACESVGDLSTKLYETQVLHMSVPMDDESEPDHLPPRPRHHISLDNVSYISKHMHSRDMSGSDEDHSNDSESPNIRPLSSHSRWDTSKSLSGVDPMSGRNPAYERFSNNNNNNNHLEEDDLGPLNISSTNENVMFGRRHQLDHSPVEDTTEL